MRRTSRRARTTPGLKYIKQTESQLYKGLKISKLRKIFDLHKKENWKDGFISPVNNKTEAEELTKAIQFYQGTDPSISQKEILIYPHPDALVKIPKTVYFVKSKGYLQ